MPARADKRVPDRALGPTLVRPAVLGKVGESFAVSLCALRRSLAAMQPLAGDPAGVLTAGLAELARLEHVGVQIQQLAHLLGGGGPTLEERVDLSRAAGEALARWKQPTQGQALSASAAPFFVDVDAAALEQLLDLALEHALHVGADVGIAAAMQGRPARPMLSITSQPTAGSAIDDAGADELHGLLFSTLARAVGLTPQCRADGPTITWSLAFRGADVARAPEGVSGTAEVTRTASVVGRHVLLIEPGEMVRLLAFRLMEDAGMRVDAFARIDKARVSLRIGPPDVVVIGLAVDDASSSAFLDDARAAQPRLRVIQLVDDDDAFSFSVPGSNRPAQIGRQGLEHTLVEAVAEELDAAWGD